MDNNITEHFRTILELKAREMEHTLKQMKENDVADQDVYSPKELSSYDNHPADTGTQLFELEHNKALKIHDEHLLKEVQEALGRIDNGIYGKCAFCGNEISRKRLEAVPYARLCIKCEEDKAVTPKMLRKIRPNEELVLDAPMGRKYLNEREDDEYEGIDQLNDLMKYGSSDTPQDMGGYHDYEEFYTNDIDKQGIVDDMDQVSNKEYRKQLPD